MACSIEKYAYPGGEPSLWLSEWEDTDISLEEKLSMTESSEELPRDSAGWIVRTNPDTRPPLTGDEQFEGAGGATVTDFWRFAMNDLQMNNTRGYLAEFLVGRALGSESNRVEWDPFDLLWHPTPAEAVRIEVKSSAYLQSWQQRNLSRPLFSGLKGKVLNDDLSTYSADLDYHADIYVMCLNGQKDPTAFDPLDVSVWKYFVVPRPSLASSKLASVSLRWLDRHGYIPVTYDDLESEVNRVWKHERKVVLTSVRSEEQERARQEAPFGVPLPFAKVDGRAIAPCTSCGRTSRYDARVLHVIRSVHNSTKTGHFDIYCPAHLEQWKAVQR